jgi:hypothetical protein
MKRAEGRATEGGDLDTSPPPLLHKHYISKFPEGPNGRWGRLMTEGLHEQYEAVLVDLRERRTGYVNAIKELDAMIEGMTRQLEALKTGRPISANFKPVTASDKNSADETPPYANMSVRWAVLKLLASADRPIGTGDIAKALEAGGVESKGQRFSSIVSAVLSDMKSKKGEVESAEDGYYRLTNQGREAWEHIEKSARYRDRGTAKL